MRSERWVVDETEDGENVQHGPDKVPKISGLCAIGSHPLYSLGQPRTLADDGLGKGLMMGEVAAKRVTGWW